MDDFYVLVALYAKEGREAELRTALAAVVEPSRSDEGNLRYEMFEDQADPRRFVFLEHWASPETQHKHHTGSRHILDFNAKSSDAVEKVEIFYRLTQVI